MNNLKKIRLSNGAVLHIEEGIVTCFDRNLHQFELTRGQQKMLHKLADNINHPLTMSILYEAYTGETAHHDSRGIRDNVSKMKHTLPKCIKTAIKSVRGYGYILEGVSEDDCNKRMVTHQSQPSENFSVSQSADKRTGRFTDLVGDYYGFYLDPLGTGAVLGAYIHIENAGAALEPQLDAYAILGVRSEQVLLCEHISALFSKKGINYKEKFKAFKKTLGDNDKRCSWWQGNVSVDGKLAVIDLEKNSTGARWKIILDMQEYMKCRRDREKDNDYYRGGLGVVLATRTIHGTICLRFGLVRKTSMKPSIRMSNEEMKLKLKLLDDSKEALWKPLKLSGWLDKHWYDWIMTE